MADQNQQRGRRGRRSRQRVQREEREAQRRKRYMIGGGVIAAVVLVILALTVVEYLGQEDDAEEADDFPPIQVASAGYEDIESEPYFLGDPDAPVQLTEWSDYQ